MMMKTLAAIAAAAMAGLGQGADAVERAPERRAAKLRDPHDEARAKHRAARTFVAADGLTYPVGPCGYVPKSAKLDPARERVR